VAICVVQVSRGEIGNCPNGLEIGNFYEDAFIGIPAGGD
jgi:hypothetical protein